jgi:hypothetical protein
MDELDRILSSDETIVASSGFAARVMDAVQDAATAPPPLPFPWGRFAIGLAACGVWAATAIGFMTFVDLFAARLPGSLADVAPELGCAAAATFASVGALRAQRILTME